METGSYLKQDPELVNHERTYKAFSILIRWSMLLIGDATLALTLWFATPMGFLGAAVVGLVVFILGYIFLIRHEEQQPLDVWEQGR